MERQVGQARATLAAFQDDLVTLNGHAADVRASREEADRALAAAKRNDVSSQADWHRKLHDRRKEVLSYSACVALVHASQCRMGTSCFCAGCMVSWDVMQVLEVLRILS